MSDLASGALATGLAITFGTSIAVFVVGWVIARLIGRVNVVDTVWGLAFVAIATAAFGWSAGHPADLTRRVVLLALVSCWGLRLAGYLGRRSRGAGEDPRYERMLAAAKGSRQWYALTRVFLLQAAVAWFVSLPVQVGMYERSGPTAIALVGGVLWAIGFFFEAVGDAQLASFKRDPENKGHVLDRGLWRYTRHPNYFGEACMWTGLYLIAAQQWPGALTVLSPAVMTYFVAAKTGKPLLEAQLRNSKPAYRGYVERTSGFFPLPPRSRS
jgi:steroid 5-alpha reductase family enzyme